jgi:2-polyprenyl-3-methyl-5-hydroxy-6-metoxy-1,4-benzoquinol methylase
MNTLDESVAAGDQPDHPGARKLIWTPELTKRFWNYHTQFQDSYFTAQYGENIVRAVRRRIPRSSRVLDYACGTGGLTGYLLDEGMQVAATDFSPESLTVVEKAFKNNKNFLGAFPMDRLHLASKPFDVAMLVELIEHVDDEALNAIFNEVKGVLLPGGLIIVTTPNEESLMNETVFCPSCEKTFHRWQHVRSWSASSLSGMFVRQGLKVVEIFATDFSISPRRGRLKYLLRRVVRSLLGRKLPHLVGMARNSA